MCTFTDYEEQPVRIRLTDVNDEIPEFKNVPRPFLTTVSASAPPGTSVYQLMAQDDDQGSTVRYLLESGQCSRMLFLSIIIMVLFPQRAEEHKPSLLKFKYCSQRLD